MIKKQSHSNFYITYYASKHKKMITRHGTHGEKSRFGKSKHEGLPYYIYFDLEANNYRCASQVWKIKYCNN